MPASLPRSCVLLLGELIAVALLPALAAAQAVSQFAPPGKQHLPLLHLDGRHAAVADLDGDGDLDLVLAGGEATGANRWLRNDGTAVFADGGPIAVGADAGLVLAGDLDGDGATDLVWRPEGALVLQRQTATGFADITAAWLQAPIAAAGTAAALGDADGDGDLDLAVATTSQGVSLLRNAGNGSLGAVMGFPGIGTPDCTTLRFFDADGDGDLDLLALGGPHGALLVNRGGMQFADEGATRLPALGGTPRTAEPCDLDGDGRDDLAVLVDLAPPGSGSAVCLLRNTAGVFTIAAGPLATAPALANIACGDVDGDGDADLLVAVPASPPALLENRGGWQLVPATGAVAAGATACTGFAAADLDGDGDDDFAAYRQGQPLLLLAVAGRLVDATRPLAGPDGVGLTAQIDDFDGDGIADVAVTTAASALGVHWGLGQGRFGREQVAVPLPERPIRFRIADLDGDGDGDAVVVLTAEVRVYENRGGRAFTAAPALPPVVGAPQTVSIADLDGDGLDDLIVGAVPSPTVRTGGTNEFANLGGLRFANLTATHLAAAQGTAATYTSLGDVDGDGDIDLLATAIASTALLLNDGRGFFTDASSLLAQAPGWYGDRTVLLDYDGDGDLDVLRYRGGSSSGRRVFLLRNDMPLAFQDISSQLPLGVLGASVTAVDVDLDGDPDLVSEGGGLLRNQHGTLVAEPIPPVAWLLAAGDLDGDGDPDLLASGAPPMTALLNRHRQLELPRVAEPGCGYTLAITSRPGYLTGGPDVGFPVLGIRPANLTIPGWGVLGVDPGTLVNLPLLALAAPGGRAELQLTLPADPSLRGAAFYLQAAVLQVSTGQGLTAALGDRVE